VWRIGVLSGTGTARKRIIPALVDSDVCRVTVVHGRDRIRLKDVANIDPAIQLVGSEDEFAELWHRYDVIYIASPPFLHAVHLQLAARLGMPVICEKPLVADCAELSSTMKVIEQSGIPFMMAHHVRHQPAVTDIAELVVSRRFGPPVSACLQWCFMMDHTGRNAQWKLQSPLGGTSALFDSGVHAVDLAVRLFGAPRRVSAVAHHVRSVDVFDSAVALLEYSDFAATVVASQSASPYKNDLSITFASCVVRVEGLFGEKSADAIDLVEVSGSTRLTYEPVNLYRAEVESFCKSLGGRMTTGTTIREAAVTMSILAATETAVETGRMIRL
jgi:predicted dehydrogenase